MLITARDKAWEMQWTTPHKMLLLIKLLCCNLPSCSALQVFLLVASWYGARWSWEGPRHSSTANGRGTHWSWGFNVIEASSKLHCHFNTSEGVSIFGPDEKSVLREQHGWMINLMRTPAILNTDLLCFFSTLFFPEILSSSLFAASIIKEWGLHMLLSKFPKFNNLF